MGSPQKVVVTIKDQLAIVIRERVALTFGRPSRVPPDAKIEVWLCVTEMVRDC